MRDDELEREAYAWYADRIRRGDGDAHLAGMLLDLEQLTPLVGAGLPHDVAAFLRAKLWFEGSNPRRRGDRTVARKALALLGRVPQARRKVAWLEMVAGLAGLCADVPPAVRGDRCRVARASAAHDVAVRCPQPRLARVRALAPGVGPAAAECYTHEVASLDGLRAAAARRWDEIPACLERARSVTGCPHLNSGGFRLDLVQRLVRRRRHLDACRAYLDRAAQFRASKQLSALRGELESAAAAGTGRP